MVQLNQPPIHPRPNRYRIRLRFEMQIACRGIDGVPQDAVKSARRPGGWIQRRRVEPDEILDFPRLLRRFTRAVLDQVEEFFVSKILELGLRNANP